MYNLTDIKTIKDISSKYGFTFSKSMGQNFLTDETVLKRIAFESISDENTGVIEIGPGFGTLTAELAKSAKKVVAIELDKRLLPVLKDTLSDFGNVSIVNADAMKIDMNALINAELSGLKPILCANLPYYITTPIISSILENRAEFETMTYMVQKEVANRLCATHGNRDYGAITAMLQYYSTAEKLFDVHKQAFTPVPKVDSSVIKLTRFKNPAFSVNSEQNMFKIVKAAFSQRRKTLANALSGGLSGRFSKSELESAIIQCGFEANIRGECLAIADFAKLSDILYK